jgi:hypothetical protein
MVCNLVLCWSLPSIGGGGDAFGEAMNFFCWSV